jgi:hypothetical protein
MSMVRSRLLPLRAELLQEARPQDALRVLPRWFLPRRAAVQEGAPAVPDRPREADGEGGEDGRGDRGRATRAEGECRERGGEGEGEVQRGWRRRGERERKRGEVVWWRERWEGWWTRWAEEAEGKRALLVSEYGTGIGDIKY